MGKSPGKWIKTVLFGKKTSKTNFSKNATAERKVSADVKGPTGGLAADPLAATDVPAQITHESGENTVLERGLSANLSVDAAQLHGEQVTEATGQANLVNSADTVQLEEAATKAQAAFRGYLARRAFKALKGIIRLQALIRGHLVRRQAVSTLRSMHAIVKFQALVRGRQVRLSDAGREVIRNLKSGQSMESKRMDMIAFVKSSKLSRNSFVTKLVASFPTVMPLSLQYDMIDPNSVWSWLERWSSSHFWEPLTRPKKHVNSKRQRKQVNAQTSERESGKAKRVSQRAPASNGDSSSLRSSVEHEKPKRNPRKVPAHQAEPVQDQPQSELERVKRNLKKVATMIEEASDKTTEAATEKSSLKRASNSPAPDVSGQVIDTPSQTITEPVTISEQPEVEPPPKPLETEEAMNTLVGDDHPAIESLSLENGDKVSNSDKLNEELSSKEDHAKENQKTRRRKSLPVKQDYSENVSQNTPTRPSYMQATESAKAKLRAQASPKLGEEEVENGFVRRHSLPSSTNGKPSLLSPRVQKPLVHSNGKGGSKSDKSLLSSRDGTDKGLPGWRR